MILLKKIYYLSIINFEIFFPTTKKMFKIKLKSYRFSVNHIEQLKSYGFHKYHVESFEIIQIQ